MIQNEEWTHINGYDGLYIISNLGQVKRFIKGRWKILKPNKNKYGYLFVNLCKNGKSTSYRIHRLVALHFIPNPENKPQVNHIDENKENNVVSNLEWMTSKENNNHGTRNVRHSKTRKEKFKNGEYRKGYKKVSCYDIETGNFIREFESLTQASNVVKNSPNHRGDIANCCRGKYKYAYGYYWSYEKKDNFFDE